MDSKSISCTIRRRSTLFSLHAQTNSVEGQTEVILLSILGFKLDRVKRMKKKLLKTYKSNEREREEEEDTITID